MAGDLGFHLINADFTRRVVLDTSALPWVSSPQRGVRRKLLERIGGEVARATSLVEYAAGSAFREHVHELGEEFFVLNGVFSDDTGDFPAGTYVRNPPGSRHAPRSTAGCTILVKLRQMRDVDAAHVVVDTRAATQLGAGRVQLYTASDDSERVTLERLACGAELVPHPSPDLQEIFVLSGVVELEQAAHGAGTWLRNPPGQAQTLLARSDAVCWVKQLRGDRLPNGKDG